ncbi:hypothetical protein F4821DRAFT_249343 [Hypoxylon rubiginosum]|uniref:Uncharacterized protein n=1 Tax=Hypoxylon rubiginosum TaxID=110542 RepID=A0ACC0CM15_9PEZI|nr:hypothetical protein F4821DRAFT_249343 [Hypoxylon rubiginosum]
MKSSLATVNLGLTTSYVATGLASFVHSAARVVSFRQRPYPLILLNAKDCPFCDEWAVDILLKAIKKDKHKLEKDDTVPITVARFKRHVATHQEQLAIFVARGLTYVDENDEDGQINPDRSDDDNPTSLHFSWASDIPSISGESSAS